MSDTISTEEYNTFLNNIIEDGIAAASKDFANYPDRLEGAVGGFNACRNKSTDELSKLLNIAKTAFEDVRQKNSPDYWKFRCYLSEIEWVCNCVSAMLFATNQPTILMPTARGYMKMAKVLGLK